MVLYDDSVERFEAVYDVEFCASHGAVGFLDDCELVRLVRGVQGLVNASGNLHFN